MPLTKGYPDFFGFSMFPYRGRTKYKEYNGIVVVDGGGLGVIGLTEKSTTAGGYIHVYNATTLAGITIQASIDDAIFQPIALSDMVSEIGNVALGIPYRISEYNMAKLTATIIVQPDIPFGFEYILLLNNNSGNDITIKSQVMYHEVT